MSSLSDVSLSQIQSLDESSKKEIMQFVQQETSKSKVQMSIHQFTDLCFKKCITSIKSNQLSSAEEDCMANCLNRFLDTNIKVVSQLQNMQN
ncbi:Mitochondrial intermembrane space protein [Komagataella phaffii CBS 7435]|uniref:Mitochondrial import inner membrane translocase subunit n=1 Tax=Komagataella phaffii (strain ATCC 76273 / CBS 7435 / CECT 11047 / NRRL Y-11430 / Wegner 21-1) TaxID=981350 RepID=A0A1G4KQ73_KOMPC|nr:Mitochondrial intermembrane space protein [Komagataella phaffii CBS 7435]SCV12155.1 Mitochondrial intermembrane space protein [Komagataella phaffii CBS 7435]